MPILPSEVTVYGATGFTGRQTAKHLAAHAPAGLRWSIAGRDPQKLAALQAQLTAPNNNPPQVIVADATKPADIRRLVRASRVLLQLAGPYARHGEPLVAAVADMGHDYLDLTGEIPWVAEMMARYQAKALASGARIVPVAGFEALPFDVTAYRAARRLRQETGQKAVALDLLLFLSGPSAWRPRDVLSGGTTASIRAMLTAEGSASITDVAALIEDAASAEALRAHSPIDLAAAFDVARGLWTGPTIPAPFVNPPVLYRSFDKLAQGRNAPFAVACQYRERLSMASFSSSLVVQRGIAAALAAAFAQARREPGPLARIQRKALAAILERWGPQSGEGPSTVMLEKSGYRIEAKATAADGQQVTLTAAARGHPGYKSTAMLVAEAGLWLAGAGPDRGSESVKKAPKLAGFLTPAMVFRDRATAGWARAGMTFADD
jgi:short subunit dehydrogenase-like uncharacterized protein